MGINRIRLSIFIISIWGMACSNQNRPKHSDQNGDYKLVWSDEFDYTGLPDSTRWSFDTAGNAHGWGNNEQQYYTAGRLENAEVKDGKLFITALREETNGKAYSSARLMSKGKGDWLYGKFKIRAKLPEGRGLWPAIWMLPSDWEYGGWPASGEIDIMENVGYMPDTILCTVHTKSYNHTIHTQRGDSIVIRDCYTNFHVYQLEWDPEVIRLSVDEQLVFTFTNEESSPNEWPFNKRFHILLNLAVGGNWGGMKGIDNTIFPRSMEVDYVRVYQKE